MDNKLHEGLRRLYGHLNLETLPQVALSVAHELVPCEVAAYDEIDPARGRVISAYDPADHTDAVARLVPAWKRFMHQHPLIAHFHEHRDDRPRKITDFLPQNQFRQTDLYQQFFRPLGLEYQMVTLMPVPAPLLVGIAHNRGRRDFTERERRTLDLVRPHLRQAYENAVVVTELQLRGQRLEQVMDRIDRGITAIDVDCHIRHISPAALRAIGEFLPDEKLTATQLPETLARWAQQQIAALEQQDHEPSHPRPLVLDGPHGRLLARLIRDIRPSAYIVVLSRAAKLQSPELLCGLHLTRREAHVLYWCIEGKSRGEIAIILHISERTVQKHLEHIYDKLHVTNRLAAVSKAVEWLRW